MEEIMLNEDYIPVLESYEVPTLEECGIAVEGLFSTILANIFPFSSIGDKSTDDATPIDSFYNVLASRNELFGKAPETAPIKIQFEPVKVDEKRGFISFTNINYGLLFKRINETYQEKHLDKIFYRTYRGKDITLFNKKKLSRGQMKITSLITPVFFALEASILFSELGKKYRDRTYNRIAKLIYERTWLSNADKRVPESIDLSYGTKMLNPRFKLKPHQEEFIRRYPALKAQLNLRGYYNAFDQGLGKTLTASVLAMSLHVDKIYVICPNTLVPNWYNEINEYFDGRVIPYDCKSTKSPHKNARVFITNNESIKAIMPYIDKNCRSMLIVDEGHNFRNINSARVAELIKLREALQPKDVLLMSGTPLKASPNELVPALSLLDPLFTPDAARIYNACFNFNNYEAMAIVTARLGKVIYRKMKSDVLQLPEKSIDDIRLTIRDPHPYSMKKVREDVMDWYARIYPDVVKENIGLRDAFCRLVRQYSTAGKMNTEWYLRRICRFSDVDTGDTLDNLHEIDQNRVTTFLRDWVFVNPACSPSIQKTLIDYEAKLIHYDQVVMGRAIGKVYPPRRNAMFIALWDENEKLFEKMITENLKKTVIFSQFAPVIKHISERLTALGIKNVRIDGTIVNQKRAENLNIFHHDEEVRAILATSQSMGTGVTLIEASQMFFFGAPWRSADYDQCCDRIYRIGQDVPVFIYNILLDSGEFNLSDRMDKIMKWSSEMFHAAVDITIVEEAMLTGEPVTVSIKLLDTPGVSHHNLIRDSLSSLF
ncbi:MAG: DEAD/DEAH box helicase [Lachnospiraceae bacterium]|nr:DEAD/DEAH box helicase [Lachnospiraceae bacterium]